MHKKSYLFRWLTIATVFLAVITMLSIVSSTFLDIAKTLVEIIAPGRSMSKVFLCEAYFLFIAILAILSLVSKKTKAVFFTAKKEWVIGLFGISYALNLISYFWFIIKYHFGISEFFIVFNNGALSSTQFFHTHVFKGVFGIVTQYFHHGPVVNLDSGTAFVGLLPTWFFVVGAIALTATFIYSTVYFFQSFHGKQETPRKAINYILVYGLSTFILLKSIIDGGFFDHATLPAFFFLILILLDTSKRKRLGLIILVGLYAAITLVVYAISDDSTWVVTFFIYIYQIASVFLLFTVTWLFMTKERVNRLHVLLCILLALSIGYAYFNDAYDISGVYSYQSEKIVPGATVLSSYIPINSPDYQKINSIGTLNFYIFNGTSTSLTVGDLLNKNHLLEDYYPISLPWQSCVPLGRALLFNFDLATTKPFSDYKKTIVDVASSTPFSKNNGMYNYHVILRLNACFPQQLDIIEQYFTTEGLTTFYISNIDQTEYEYSVD